MLSLVPSARLALAAILAVSIPVSAATAETGRDVMERVYKQSDIFPQSKATVRLSVLDKKGRERERFFELRTKNGTGYKRSLAKFFKPANVKGVGLASQTNQNTQVKKQWVYFPSLKSVKQLSASEQDGSFMGSDFSYSDIAGRTLDQDTHKIFQEDEKFYVIESVPVATEDAYSKYYTTIYKSNNIVRAVAFYDRSGDELKRLQNRKLVKVEGELVVALSVMSNLKTGGSSTMDRSKIDVSVNFGDNDVGLKGLKAN